MRQFSQQVLVRNQWVSEKFSTEPIEAGWAEEAIFYVEIVSTNEEFKAFDAKVQISPNGIVWVDEGTSFEGVSEKGLYFKKVSHFGGWLRLNCKSSGDESSVKLMIYLILKE